MISTSASHVVAAVWFLNPLLAARALFKLFTFNKFFKFGVKATDFVTYLEFGAGLASVELYAAVETVEF